MTMMDTRRLRGVISVRAEAAGDLRTLINEVQTAFAAFREANDQRLAALEQGREDTVLDEKVERVNNEVGVLQSHIDRLNQSVAALEIGSATAVGDRVKPDVAAHARAFDRWFRKGIAGDLSDLEVKAALTTESNPDGGWFVPEEMDSMVDQVLKEVSPMRQIATVRTVGTGTYKKLVNLHGTGSGWVGETESRPETTGPTLSELEFPVMEIYAMPKASQELLDDSRVDIGGWLAGEVELEFAFQEGNAFVVGDGNKKPRGFLGYTNIADASYEWGKIGYVVTGASGAFLTTAEGDDYDNLVDLQMALKSAYRGGARWVMNRSTQGAVRKIKDGDGNPTWIPTMMPGQPATLLGDPVTELPDMPDIAANSLSIAYGDFRRAYLIVDRFGVRVLRDPFTAKPFVQFYTTKRVGGGVQNFEAIKLLKFGTS
jgi:HK97 family phage major capsid protein